MQKCIPLLHGVSHLIYSIFTASFESGGSPSPRGLLQPQLDIRRFCAQLNGVLENERAGLITSLGGNKGKGIVIHEEPAGLQRNKVSSGNLSVEGKGKGILIEENVHSGKFSSKPYICANFQNPTIMQGAGWSMVGMNGTSFGSSNPDNHHPCKTYAMKSFETNGQHLSPNTFEKPVNMDMDNGSLFDDVMLSEAEMEELMDFIYSDLEEKKQEVGKEREREESGGSLRGLLQLQLDRTSFCVELNEAVENEWAGLITSLGRNNGKGIVIHEKPAGLQSNKVSSEKLSVEGKGKGILIEENVHSGKFSSKPYCCANFQNPTIMQGAGWPMVGMNGTSFGSSNPDNHLANLQNDNQVPAPHGVCTNTLVCLKTPCKTSVMQSFETNGQTIRANTS
nr:hypothetical protein Itr_chr04CG07370 [Ipomoea trifida]